MAQGTYTDGPTSVSLVDVVDISSLQEIQDHFSQVTGMGAIIVDLNGEPITNYSMFSPLCQCIRNHPQGLKRCQMSDAELGARASQAGTTQIHYCHAGLIDIAAPIIVNDTHVGTILCGQIMCDAFDVNEGQQLFDQCVESLDLDGDQMRAYRSRINQLPQEKIQAAAGLLQVIANHIVGMSLNHLNDIMISDINLRMVEEQKARLDLERSLRVSELKSLQSTVNPHFLFNALNTIARLAMLEDAPKTEEITFALADLLRHSLRKVGKLVPLQEEVEHIQKYLQIQSVRFSDRIRIRIDAPEDTLDFRLPVMTLQPLVENAIEHGLNDTTGDGEILVRARREEHMLVLSVSDNGQGMDPEQLQELQEYIAAGKDTGRITGIGLMNVYKQLRFYFGDRCNLELSSEPGRCTAVTIRADEMATENRKASADA